MNRSALTPASLLDSLNPAQRQAVSSDANRLLVLAGAGSGKTRVLVHRIAWLVIARGLSPRGILAVTFTNKAAAEMRHRLQTLLQIPQGAMWVGTFHGIAHRLLRLHWQEAKLPEQFQVMDSDDQQRVLKRVMREMQLEEARWPVRQAQSYINSHKDEGKRPAHIQHFGDVYNRTMVEVYERYQAACEVGGLVDFAELLLRSHELWLHHPELLRHYQQRFRHVLVDEFQDTNGVQYAWLRVLVGQEQGITIVGDDDQSIYGWRGAKVENIQRFSEDFGGAETVRLEQNYRSTANILNAANAVIGCNRERLGKQLWTEGKPGEPISVYPAFNDLDEARFVVERIQQHLHESFSYRDIAILYRSNAQSRLLEEALMKAGVPYRIYGGQRFFDRLEIRNALAYMRLINYRHDDAAFERVLNVPPRGIGERTVEQIREEARRLGQSMWIASLSLLEYRGLSARAGNALRAFLGLIEHMHQETLELSLADLIDHVVNASGLYEYHEKEKGDRGEVRTENLRELINAAREFEVEDEIAQSPLQEFISRAALEAGDGSTDTEEAVQLMTLHAAKGLEFPLVFMVGVEEGLFPSTQSNEDPSRLEEERRLCYVGITRAMKKLYMTYAECRRLYGSDQIHAPSRFLREIPAEVMQEVRSYTSITRPTSGNTRFGGGANSTASGTSAPKIVDSSAPFQLGQRVAHAKFGEGVVIQTAGNGASARVEVNFRTAGRKELMLQYANLQALPN
ncbi:Superfamily I DNA and RNA helicases [gamma proteobacterium HdN1]|nr:Superfamily I DNA and RNA helicases [gamma proteobacterium HdN1]